MKRKAEVEGKRKNDASPQTKINWLKLDATMKQQTRLNETPEQKEKRLASNLVRLTQTLQDDKKIEKIYSIREGKDSKLEKQNN